MTDGIHRVLVTGSRIWPQDHIGDIGAHLQPIAARDNRVVLVHGGAAGVDAMADRLWRTWGMVEPEIIRAPWDWPCLPRHRKDPLTGRAWCRAGHRKKRRDGSTYCPKMGHRRNQRMVDLGADVAFAFIFNGNGSRGTLDCARRAEAAGIPTTRIELDL